MENRDRITDIQFPRRENTAPPDTTVKNNNDPPPTIIAREAPLSRRSIAAVSFAILATIGGFVAFYAIGFVSLKEKVREAVPDISAKFKEAHASLKNFDLRAAEQSLRGIDSDVQAIKKETDGYQPLALANAFSVVPKLKIVPEVFETLAKLSGTAIEFMANLETVKTSGFSWLMGQNGELLNATIERLDENTTTILELTATLKDRAATLGYPLDDSFTKGNADLYGAERFLKTLGSWLRKPGEKHVLVLFQNQSEIRPGGGFIGSYGDLVFQGNNLTDINVHDIYPADRELEKEIKIVPPRELQGITPLWGARDANWFFHFPTSAEKVMRFLESSPLYRERNTEFDDLIAINVSVIESLLGLTGPIELPEYERTITSENFLSEIQREVETGEDKFVLRQPKRILGVLAPKLFDAVGTFSDETKKALLEGLERHLERKDIVFYSRNLEMQNFFENKDVAGTVFQLPNGTPSEYLAVVDANVAGGKSDAFVTQKIKFSSKIDAVGRIDNYLTIERSHAGAGENDWWYRAKNHNYLKVLTPRGSQLIYAAGGDLETVTPVRDYQHGDYIRDPDLTAIEATRQKTDFPGVYASEEYEKTAFGTWFSVRAGQTEKFEMQYLNPYRFSLVGGGSRYMFAFDRQSGVKTSLDVLIEAPKGYHWLENGGLVFNYFSEDPPRRVKVDLTLVRDEEEDRRRP